MVDHTFEELKKQTVAQLREIAEGMEHEALRGYKSMRKDDLVQALCTAKGVDPHVHHEVVGVDKGGIKKKIRALKVERDAALEKHDSKELKRIRRRIKRLKNTIRRATV